MTEACKQVIDSYWRAGSDDDSQRRDPKKPKTKDIPHFEQVPYYREFAPGTHRDTYDKLIRMNCLPRIAAAVCQYAASLDGETPRKSQAEVAREYNASGTSIQKWYARLSGSSETRGSQ